MQLSAVPTGLGGVAGHDPSVETLGYFHPSLRDEESQIPVLLPESEQHKSCPTLSGWMGALRERRRRRYFVHFCRLKGGFPIRRDPFRRCSRKSRVAKIVHQNPPAQ